MLFLSLYTLVGLLVFLLDLLWMVRSGFVGMIDCPLLYLVCWAAVVMSLWPVLLLHAFWTWFTEEL